MVIPVSYSERGSQIDSPLRPISRKVLDVNPHLQEENYSDTGLKIADQKKNLDDVMAGRGSTRQPSDTSIFRH